MCPAKRPVEWIPREALRASTRDATPLGSSPRCARTCRNEQEAVSMPGETQCGSGPGTRNTVSQRVAAGSAAPQSRGRL
jgi:hypothetical protein